MTAPATDAPSCPKCGGDVWDNRASKRTPQAPDFKCRDRSCDGCIWPPRGGRTVRQADAPSVLEPDAQLPQPPEWAGHGGTPPTLCAEYLRALDFVLAQVKPRYERAGVPLDGATIAATCATLFIAKTKCAK